MLPATRQRWHSRPYPSRSWYSIKRPRRDARLSWSRCARDLPLPSPGSLGWPFPMLEYNYIFSKYYIRKQFCQTALENCYGLKLRKYWLQFKNKFIASFIKSFGTFSWRWWWIWFAWSQSQSKGSEKSTSTAKRILRPRSCLCMELFTVFCGWGFVCQRVQEESGRLESRCGFLEPQVLVQYTYKLQLTSSLFALSLNPIIHRAPAEFRFGGDS